MWGMDQQTAKPLLSENQILPKLESETTDWIA